ncbi:FtsX-like permease family protein [Streptomyces sp. NPDC097619]|uniref:FtsX-like permease family protein n=1 Tax=Streptomyces sp. NPDC097619 TaxID=3157228 RepID=UPI0033213965
MTLRTTRQPLPAPWVRTRLRSAPAAALAFALLVCVTAFLAAVLPRAVEAYETDGLRRDIAGAPADRTVLRLTMPQPGLEHPQAAREEELRPTALARTHAAATAVLPAPVRADPAQSSYGVRSTGTLIGTDPWLPRPEAVPPQFTLAAPAGLDRHATVTAGRLPAVRDRATAATREVEAAVTEATARALRLRTGSVVHLAGRSGGAGLAVRITGLLAPRDPGGAYWAAVPVLGTPGMAGTNALPPQMFWQGGLLIAPGAAPALLATELRAEPERYWHFAPATAHLTARDAPALAARTAALEGGPAMLDLRRAAGDTAVLTTGLDRVLASHLELRDAIGRLVAVAVFGIAAVAAVVLAMAGGLATARRTAELTLLRARGASLTGLAVRLGGETAVVALPAAALGLLAALMFAPGTATGPAVLAATAVAVLACAVLPVRAVLRHRVLRPGGERADLIRTRPGARRTVAELTLLALAAASVAALRGRSADGGADVLVSAAPVLTGLIAATVLVRLYPTPLRWALRPAARMRGAVGFLSLARAGRSAATGALPVLALLTALSTAAFGGSVLAGVEDTRDLAALVATGADARVSAPGEALPLAPGTATAVRSVPGVRTVTELRVERTGRLVDRGGGTENRPLALVGVAPGPYAELAAGLGFGAFPASLLEGSGAALPAVASPGTAERLGTGPRRIALAGRELTVRVVAVRERTPAVPDSDFLLIDAAALAKQPVTALLVSGAAADPAELRTAVRAVDPLLTVRSRAEARVALTDSPLQEGAGGVYRAALAAGAGYAVAALVLSLLQSAPERTALLARLRTMGLTSRQGRRLLGLESLPQALLGAGGGLLVGWATVLLLAPGIDLGLLALAADPGSTRLDGVTLRADTWSLVLPAVGVLALAGAVAAGQSWWTGRRGSVTELRAGDSR